MMESTVSLLLLWLSCSSSFIILLWPCLRRTIHHWRWQRHLRHYPYAVLAPPSPSPRPRPYSSAAAAMARTLGKVVGTGTALTTGVGRWMWDGGRATLFHPAARRWIAQGGRWVWQRVTAALRRSFGRDGADDDAASTTVAVDGTTCRRTSAVGAGPPSATVVRPHVRPRPSVLKKRSSLDGTTTTHFRGRSSTSNGNSRNSSSSGLNSTTTPASGNRGGGSNAGSQTDRPRRRSVAFFQDETGHVQTTQYYYHPAQQADQRVLPTPRFTTTAAAAVPNTNVPQPHSKPPERPSFASDAYTTASPTTFAKTYPRRKTGTPGSLQHSPGHRALLEAQEPLRLQRHQMLQERQQQEQQQLRLESKTKRPRCTNGGNNNHQRERLADFKSSKTFSPLHQNHVSILSSKKRRDRQEQCLQQLNQSIPKRTRVNVPFRRLSRPLDTHENDVDAVAAATVVAENTTLPHQPLETTFGVTDKRSAPPPSVGPLLGSSFGFSSAPTTNNDDTPPVMASASGSTTPLSTVPLQQQQPGSESHKSTQAGVHSAPAINTPSFGTTTVNATARPAFAFGSTAANTPPPGPVAQQLPSSSSTTVLPPMQFGSTAVHTPQPGPAVSASPFSGSVSTTTAVASQQPFSSSVTFFSSSAANTDGPVTATAMPSSFFFRSSAATTPHSGPVAAAAFQFGATTTSTETTTMAPAVVLGSNPAFGSKVRPTTNSNARRRNSVRPRP